MVLCLTGTWEVTLRPKTSFGKKGSGSGFGNILCVKCIRGTLCVKETLCVFDLSFWTL